jgi:hypothetical protein
MSLPSLRWRKLPVRISPFNITTFTASVVLNTIYDMLTGSVYFDGSTRIAGSGSGWSASLKFTTGSNTEAIICRPPLYTTISQSVIFAGITHFGASSSATPAMCASETYSGSYIYMTSVKNASGSFTEWTSRYPFGSGSYSTGYAKVIGTAHMFAGERITIYESNEAIAVFFSNPTGTNANLVMGSIGGAIIDPEQDATSIDAEEDGRLYAIATSGVGVTVANGINETFLTNIGSTYGTLFTHRTELTTSATNYARFVGFYPQQQATMSIMAQKGNVGSFLGANGYNTSYAAINGKLVQNPIYCMVSGSSTLNETVYLGRLRDINITRAMQSSLVVKDSSNNIVGFTLGYSETVVSQSVLFPYN